MSIRKRVVAAATICLAVSLTVTPTSASTVDELTVEPGAEQEPEGERPCRDAPREPVVTRAVFNDPAAGDPTAIVRHICDLVHQAPAGSQLRIAHFVISGDAGMDFVEQLVAAHRRGVDIQVVLDGWQVDNPAVHTLAAELGTERSESSWLHICTRLSPEGNTSACIGDKGQHNKFYLFSETGGARNVVVQSSANFTDLNSTTYWNNAVTLVDNRRLFDAYGAYFEDLAAEVEVDDYYRITTTGMRSGMVRAFFFPRAGTDASTDTIVEALEKVSCEGGTRISIGMSELDDYRIAIADSLVSLSDDGCAISLVHGPMQAQFTERLRSAPAIETLELNLSRELPGRVHSKYLLVDGTFDGTAGARWVFTGSPNYNQTSLRRNDEAMLQTNLKGLYEQFEANHQAMREAVLSR